MTERKTTDPKLNRLNRLNDNCRNLVQRDRFVIEANENEINSIPFRTYFVTNFIGDEIETLKHEKILEEQLLRDFELMGNEVELVDDSSRSVASTTVSTTTAASATTNTAANQVTCSSSLPTTSLPTAAAAAANSTASSQASQGAHCDQQQQQLSLAACQQASTANKLGREQAPTIGPNRDQGLSSTRPKQSPQVHRKERPRKGQPEEAPRPRLSKPKGASSSSGGRPLVLMDVEGECSVRLHHCSCSSPAGQPPQTRA